MFEWRVHSFISKLHKHTVSWMWKDITTGLGSSHVHDEIPAARFHLSKAEFSEPDLSCFVCVIRQCVTVSSRAIFRVHSFSFCVASLVTARPERPFSRPSSDRKSALLSPGYIPRYLASISSTLSHPISISSHQFPSASYYTCPRIYI